MDELEKEWQTASDGFPAGIAFKEWLANQVIALRATAQQGAHPTSGSLRGLWASFWLRASSALKHFTSPPTRG